MATTAKTRATLTMIGNLEDGPGAYVAHSLAPTDLTAGMVHPTQARMFARKGWIEPLRDGEPLRLTPEGRRARWTDAERRRQIRDAAHRPDGDADA